ncbi:NAD(P)H-dependent flavin oxidoreductase [Paracoccus litorisediminis]|uniref:NAD(P)H-dependent flavin oxidoreductase n=1 Tax=Paracoccus litorisediminis TaxID=2006130 RepID=UPI001FE3B57A|nr:nitronate monooxygenase [Paracoccus litorisediminis]
MAGTSTPALAAAVSNAGGLGALGIGSSSVAQARAMIEETRRLTSRPINVNVICHQREEPDPARDSEWLAFLALFAEFGITPPVRLEEIYKSFVDDEDAFTLLTETRPEVVSFHFGLPAPEKIAALRALGTKTMATATNLVEARAIKEAGVDAIVAQGIEAGGHRGMFDPAAPDERLGTSVLVRLLVQNQSLPVIAAGGIMDGQGVRAALDLGAAAAQLGTAFILCPESAANAAYHESLSGARAFHTRLTAALSGRPARGMVNRFIEYCEASKQRPAGYPYAYDAAKQLSAGAVKQGEHGFAAQWAGQGAPLARAMPAADLMRLLARELRGDRV